MTDDGGRLGQRLRRILLLLPYVIKHPGVTLDELSTRLDVPKRDLVKDLDLLWMCGLPGYGPGDLIDVWLDGDQVFVGMADYFGAPLTITPAEGLNLYVGAQAVAALPGMEEADALRRALEKLRKALGTEGEGGGVELKMQPSSPHLEPVEKAIADRRRVRLEYFSASRGELTRRDVDPWGLFTAFGHWYLIGRDHSSGEERMFRADRIKDVEILDVRSTVPEDFDPERYRGAFVGGGQLKVAFELSPSAASWFPDYYPADSVEQLPDGWTAVELVAGGRRWAAVQVLKLGRDVRNVRSREVLEETRQVARRLQQRYARSAASA